jgi:hemoglobin
MRRVTKLVAGLSMGALLAFGCSSDSKPDTAYARLGGKAGVVSLVQSFLERVYADTKINGYFLNSSVDQGHLRDCIVKQMIAASGGPDNYDCRTMKEAHGGLGISKQDFEDFTADLTQTLADEGVAEGDMDALVAAVAPMSEDIVEDESNVATLYQKLGRKPAVAAVIHAFVEKVGSDTRINAFFADTNLKRIEQCLVRQVCQATGGPCKYGKEPLESHFESDEPDITSWCRDMEKTHHALGIAYADFGALVEDLVETLESVGVSEADRTTIVNVLSPLCPDIVTQGTCG